MTERDEEEQPSATNTNNNNNNNSRRDAAGGNEVSGSSYCYALLWFLLLLVVAWPLALICAVLWVLIQPCEPCMDGADAVQSCLYPFLRYPRRVGRAIYACDTEMPKPVPKPDNVQSSNAAGGPTTSTSGRRPKPPTMDEEHGY